MQLGSITEVGKSPCLLKTKEEAEAKAHTQVQKKAESKTTTMYGEDSGRPPLS